VNWLPYLKFRTTYGYSGNIDPSKSALPVAGTTLDIITGQPIARIQSPNNKNLRWEQVGQLNIAADFSFKGNRISGSIDYYRKKSSDLYGMTYYDYTAWGQSNLVTQNTADIMATGLDVQVNTKNIDRKFKWNTDLLLSLYKDKTLSYNIVTAQNIYSVLGGGRGIIPLVGKPLYAIAAYKWGGLDAAGNPQSYVDGKLSTDYTAIFNEASTKGIAGNIKYIGTGTPTIYGSVQNSFSWRNISLQANISYKFMYYTTKPSLSYESLINNGAGHAEYAERWQRPGDEKKTNVPSLMYPNNYLRDDVYGNSEINVIKADHVRLQYINLSYTFDKRVTSRLRIQDLQLYFNAANLGIIWRSNKDGIDPDYAYSFSAPKAYAFGIRASLK
jgi:hypothetical protein